MQQSTLKKFYALMREIEEPTKSVLLEIAAWLTKAQQSWAYTNSFNNPPTVIWAFGGKTTTHEFSIWHSNPRFERIEIGFYKDGKVVVKMWALSSSTMPRIQLRETVNLDDPQFFEKLQQLVTSFFTRVADNFEPPNVFQQAKVRRLATWLQEVNLGSGLLQKYLNKFQ